ncbi:hypothetical protein HNQ07_001287 [Deinococcus metalli]|uniref:Uncharacterized protein n=1 Tax=Deinococcus metalli TaxID=1141878 RepID=A0A7W8NPJ1_9DEIO|nr:hypothetical protein [Deinococcus metalli]MBB5375830.1 hypothetical protein [Deinococcus metalli]GHF36719.1 hypothetical protein GCM10017781_11730 [Deinococcus metalli]
MSGLKTLGVLAALSVVGSVQAVSPTLTPAIVTEALKAGEAMSIQEGGYILGSYLLRAYNEDVILRPNSPEIDGVVLGTPFERLRYEAYLARLEGKPLTTAQATAFAQKLNHKITVRVYSHSPYSVADEEEQWQLAYKTDRIKANPDKEKSYLDFFKPATMTVAGRKYAASPSVDGPYRDNFTLPSGESDFRNLGVVSYTFDIPNLPASGPFTLSFKDSRGVPYTISGTLQQYR